MKPKVSVIIPNYNHSPYLRQRIESVINQTYGNTEIILLDDCSTDRSVDIIEEYRSHPKVAAVILNDRNSGSTFRQWKKGLEAATGKYVWIAESDDYADSAFLSTLVELLERHPEAVLAYSGSEIVDSNGEIIPGVDWDHFPHDGKETRILPGRELIERRLLRNNLVYNASMALFRRDAAPEITEEFTSMRFCGDWLFWARLAMKGDAIEFRQKLNRFRQHEIKVSASASKEGRTYTEGLPVVCEMADYLNLSPLQRKVVAGRIFKRLKKFPGLESDPAITTGIRKLLGIPDGASVNPRALRALYAADSLLHFSGLLRQG